MTVSTEGTTDTQPAIEHAENIARLIAELGEEYRSVVAVCDDLREEAFRKGGADGVMDIAMHVGQDQLHLLIAGAFIAAGLRDVIAVPVESVSPVANLADVLRSRISRASAFRHRAPRRLRTDESSPLDWLPGKERASTRLDAVGRSMRSSDRVNNRLSDHVDDDQQQHIARVQSGIPGRSMRAPQNAA